MANKTEMEKNASNSGDNKDNANVFFSTKGAIPKCHLLPESIRKYKDKRDVTNYKRSLPASIAHVQRNQKRNRKFGINLEVLQELSNKEPHEILVELIEKKLEFEKVLESNSLSGNTLVWVIKILAKLCSSMFNAHKSFIMSLAITDNLIESIFEYMRHIQLQDDTDHSSNMCFWQDVDMFFNNLNIICDSLIDCVPTKACDVLPTTLKAVIVAVEYLANSHDAQLTPSIKTNFIQLHEQAILHNTKLKLKKKGLLFECENLPNNFRELSVYPSGQEILSSEPAFIRRNIIIGSYDSVDHYLDVQFRLLKEDFVAPLREGVYEFVSCDINQRRRMKFSNVRIHHHVEFICSNYFNNDKVGILLQFDFNKKPTQYNFHYSKRFMYGSLLCFTKDNFATIVFGKVIDHNMELLENQQVLVEFLPGQEDCEFNKPYLMVESSIYFEPYYHVLRALQCIHELSFPMKKYLINVNTDIDPPAYVNYETIFNISSDYEVELLLPECWPTSNQLKLDDTQYAAFKSALTQSLSIIQGPPGTGKTYLGLQIAISLIRNHLSWYVTKQAPILVVCFTNHALDQFLEGLIDITDCVLRVGQSKNERLKGFDIRSKRAKSYSGVFYDTKENMWSELRLIKYYTETLDTIEQFDSIINFEHFFSVDPDFSNTWFKSALKKDIIEWLLDGKVFEKIQQEQIEVELMSAQDGSHIENEASFDTDFEKTLDMDDQDFNNFYDSWNTFLQTTPICLLVMEDVNNQMQQIRSTLQNLVVDFNNLATFEVKWNLESMLLTLEENFKYLKMRLNELQQNMLHNINTSGKPANIDLNQPHLISSENRWKLYFHWLGLYKTFLISKLADKQEQYKVLYEKYIELKNIEDIKVMQQMIVVGMTTTSAARLQASLQVLKCPIVIVEEAAEVLESHIVVSLTNSCQQLILIGDHKQLRPTTASYKLEKDFNLGVSLFERMVRNKVPCNVLGVQHRMRPEFAKLIVPAIYPTLQNHKSVENFPPVLGVLSNLYFITHNNLEQDAGDSSKMNLHEAHFLVAFATYLVQNGYSPQEITILAAYSGQMFTLKQLCSQEQLLKDLRITVLDNFQGEESKIVLLSLVRNNDENRIGFLKNENRVCVALSRAREGFYIMGNIDILCRNSAVWPKIKQALIKQEALGTSLLLRCQLHPDMITSVQSFDDFIAKAPKGGCNEVCGVKLQCGHDCFQVCHLDNREHASYKCKSKCEEIPCEKGHKCQKMCFEECGQCGVLVTQLLICGHEHAIPCFMNPCNYKCPTLISTMLPCNHEVLNKPCYINVAHYKCPFPCSKSIKPCGHTCVRNCHIQNDPDHILYECPITPCGRTYMDCSTSKHMCHEACSQNCSPCDVSINKKRICSHCFIVPCSFNIDEMKCTKPCKKTLPCMHRCKRKCGEDCGGCLQMVNKILPLCKHTVQAACLNEPDVKNCKGECPKMLACGHPCTKLCNEPCTTHCSVLVGHTKLVDCGHVFQIPCFIVNQELSSDDIELLQYCQQPCGSKLLCKHACSGTCGRCVQGRIHTRCAEKCEIPLFCGHECSALCGETCQPCKRQCVFQCYHGTCRKSCGDPCIECLEPCRRKCSHGQCTAKCGEVCTVPPCNEPCLRTLKCGHNCIGFCGEPCPPLCSTCNSNELTKTFFGSENDENLRFVFLSECGHVVESKEMEKWLIENDEIGYKKCPKCKSVLCTTQRFSDLIKKTRQVVVDTKKSYLGSLVQTEPKLFKLRVQLNKLSLISPTNMCTDIKHFNVLRSNLITAFNLSKKQKKLNMPLIDTFRIKAKILQTIMLIFGVAKFRDPKTIQNVLTLTKLLLVHLLPINRKLTDQEVQDLNRELNRLISLNR